MTGFTYLLNFYIKFSRFKAENMMKNLMILTLTLMERRRRKTFKCNSVSTVSRLDEAEILQYWKTNLLCEICFQRDIRCRQLDNINLIMNKKECEHCY